MIQDGKPYSLFRQEAGFIVFEGRILKASRHTILLLYFIGLTLVTWQYLAQGEAGKCSLLYG